MRDLDPPIDDGSARWTQNNTADGNGTVFGVMGGNLVVHGSNADSRSDDEGCIRILMLAANPADTQRLALDREAREITRKLRLARDRDVFDLITCWAVQPEDLLQYLNEHSPHIVHFGGHGSSAGEIVLSGGDGSGRRVSAVALAELFRVMKGEIRVVVLNACYSAVQAQAIGQHIDYVIGMRAPIDDESATIFAAAFYSALGFGKPVREAFDQATTSLMLHGMPDHSVPQIHIRPGAGERLRTAAG